MDLEKKLRRKEWDRKKYAANPEKYRQASKKWREANKDKVKKSMRAWYEANVDKRREYHKERHEADPSKRREAAKRWDNNNPGKKNETYKKWAMNNPEKVRLKDMNYAKNNPEKMCAKRKKRGERIKQATPKWLSNEQLLEIASFHLDCPEGYAVDHVVPIQGKLVSGLNVPCNLQYLTKSENSKKGNRFKPTIRSEEKK